MRVLARSTLKVSAWVIQFRGDCSKTELRVVWLFTNTVAARRSSRGAVDGAETVPRKPVLTAAKLEGAVIHEGSQLSRFGVAPGRGVFGVVRSRHNKRSSSLHNQR